MQRLAPPEAFVAVYARHNPERDYQREHYARVWQTIEEERLPERLMEIVLAQIAADKRERAEQLVAEVKEALAPIDWEGLANCQESVYAQSMGFPFQEQLLCLRTESKSAADLAQAIENLFGLVAKHTDGSVGVGRSEHDGFRLVSLELPLDMPEQGNELQPTCAVRDELLLVATSPEAARAALDRLKATSQKSKFDDPRVQQALAKLPAPEDSLSVFDSRTYFQQLRKLPEMIRERAGDDAGAQKAGEIMDKVLTQFDVVDLIVTVEHTEELQNRSVAYGRLQPHVEDKVLFQMFDAGKPFDDWRQWVPDQTSGFSLSTGASLHPLYVWATQFARGVAPEAGQALDHWDEIQQEAGVNLDKDILQSFSGETVSVSLRVGEGESGKPGNVVFLRCHQPDRIRDLLHRGIEKLNELPPLAAQQIALAPVEGLEGFEQISIPALAGFGVRPLVGFRDGWLAIGSDRDALETVLATGDSQDKSFAEGERFARFGLDVQGPIQAISYAETARQNRDTAQFLRQAGLIAPGLLAMAPKGDDAPPVELFSQLLGLLPSVAKVIEQFDFHEATLSVTQPAKEPGAWTTTKVTTIRPVTAAANKAGQDRDTDE
jgi:hypothetical protein